jgi:hypothetical protein
MILKYVKPASQTLLAWSLLNFIGQAKQPSLTLKPKKASIL